MPKLVLCGHIHKRWLIKIIGKDDYKVMNINCGVDKWHYTPLNIIQPIRIFNKYFNRLEEGEY